MIVVTACVCGRGVCVGGGAGVGGGCFSWHVPRPHRPAAAGCTPPARPTSTVLSSPLFPNHAHAYAPARPPTRPLTHPSTHPRRVCAQRRHCTPVDLKALLTQAGLMAGGGGSAAAKRATAAAGVGGSGVTQRGFQFLLQVGGWMCEFQFLLQVGGWMGVQVSLPAAGGWVGGCASVRPGPARPYCKWARPCSRGCMPATAG